jgi:hypothetical protein
MPDKLKQHRVVGIRHASKRLRKAGLIADKPSPIVRRSQQTLRSLKGAHNRPPHGCVIELFHSPPTLSLQGVALRPFRATARRGPYSSPA